MQEGKQDVYAGLGHLFYSIAASDGHVSPAEIDQLKDLVKAQWTPLEPGRDTMGSDLAYYIEIGFDHAHAAKMKPEAAFEQFKAVHHRYPAVFDPSTRNMITRTAQSIANAFAGGNRSEKRMITRLEEVLK